jgi:hypothetical protein
VIVGKSEAWMVGFNEAPKVYADNLSAQLLRTMYML